jgi:hypothetical protein
MKKYIAISALFLSTPLISGVELVVAEGKILRTAALFYRDFCCFG